MTALANKTSTRRRLLLASDRSDQSSELADILQSVSDVDTISTEDIPEKPDRNLSGIVVDINLRSYESVQRVRNKLRAEAYRELPRLFVLATASASQFDAGLGAGRDRYDFTAVRCGRNSGADSLGIPRQRWIRTLPTGARHL